MVADSTCQLNKENDENRPCPRSSLRNWVSRNNFNFFSYNHRRDESLHVPSYGIPLLLPPAFGSSVRGNLHSPSGQYRVYQDHAIAYTHDVHHLESRRYRARSLSRCACSGIVVSLQRIEKRFTPPCPEERTTATVDNVAPPRHASFIYPPSVSRAGSGASESLCHSSSFTGKPGFLKFCKRSSNKSAQQGLLAEAGGGRCDVFSSPASCDPATKAFIQQSQVTVATGMDGELSLQCNLVRLHGDMC